MTEWEYLFLNYIGGENWVELQEKMTTFGELGWELVTYMDDIHEKSHTNSRLFIFKRPKQPEKREPKAA